MSNTFVGVRTTSTDQNHCGEALERLIGFYVAERATDQPATTFFARVELPRVKKLLADREVMTPEMAQAEDFVDLAETEEFRSQTTDSECHRGCVDAIGYASSFGNKLLANYRK
jgi:hypothetical protein